MSDAPRPRRSRRWILPALLVLLWVGVGGPLGTFAGKLAEVQQNDSAAFLPQGVESTQVLEDYLGFVGAQTQAATAVYERSGGLEAADRRVVAADARRFADLGSAPVASVAKPVYSADGEAAEVTVQIATTDGEQLADGVDEMRQITDAAPAGLTALVGGQGGIQADFVVAFGAIDGILLGVAFLVVLVILLVVYRSPVLPFLVLLSAGLALGVASAVIYAMAKNDVLTLNGQSQGILFILAVGAATDYALLMVARFRESLRDHESRFDAMRHAYRGAVEPIVASGLTVVLSLLCLLLSDLSNLSGLGPVGAVGVACAVLASLTFLPAVMVLLGRAAFWPARPSLGSAHPETTGVWGRVARLVGRRPRAVWAGTMVLLALGVVLVPTLDEDQVPQTEIFLTQVDSVSAQDVLDAHFAADAVNPVIVTAPRADAAAVVRALSTHDGVAQGQVATFPPVPGVPATVVDGKVAVLATLTGTAESEAANATVRSLRSDLDRIGPDVQVGGTTAILLDTRDTTRADRNRVIPAILLVIFLVLSLLLRALVAPLLLILANVLSFGATVGVSAVVFNHVLDFPPTDPSITLIGFVFLVALGIDYSIFLMTRVREESLRQGTRPGILRGLTVTGGVITSAGVVLAATFAALSVIPITFLAQIAFIVAFGVLLDTLVVRSLLVPALAYDVGRRIWWPSRLARAEDHADAETEALLRG